MSPPSCVCSEGGACMLGDSMTWQKETAPPTRVYSEGGACMLGDSDMAKRDGPTNSHL